MTKSTPDLQLEWTHKFVAASAATVTFAEQLPRNTWWRNPINRQSLRLTYPGLQWIEKNSSIPSYTISLQDPVMGRQLIQLERMFTSPYYLKPTSIVVVSEQDAVMLQLHAGDLKSYLNNQEL